MKPFLIAAASTVVFAGTASAADVHANGASISSPQLQTSNWSGLYVGLNGGADWLRTKFYAYDAVGDTSAGTISPTGGTIGGQIGYNWQLQDRYVVGVEGDVNWVDASGSAVAPNWTGGYANTKLSTMGTVRARAGILLNDPTLLYATAGYAWGRFEHSTNAWGGFVDNTTKSGWTVGGGVEYMINPHFTVKAEALYVDFGTSSTTQNVYGSGYGATFKDTAVIARIGANYKF